jgi:hypothetical protein
MSMLERVKFNWDRMGFVVGMIEKWEPKRCKTEKDYEKSLYSYLHGQLEEIQVTKQYAKGRIRADIVVADSVIVELKHNLDTTAKFQRLVGQLDEYKRWDGKIVVILTGTTEPNLRKDLIKHLRDWNSDNFELISSGKVALLSK